MLELKLYITCGTTLDEIRSFVKATEGGSGDHKVVRFNFNDEMDALGVVMDTDG